MDTTAISSITTATPEDALIWKEIGNEERARVRTLLDVVKQAAANKAAGGSARSVLAQFAAMHQGQRGFSLSRLEAAYTALVRDRKHWSVLIDKARHPTISDRTAIPLATREFFRTLCELNQRKVAPAWRDFMTRLRLGQEAIPGVGYWQDLWRKQQGTPPPAECPAFWIPDGYTLKNMRNYAPTKRELLLNRQGKKAASELSPLMIRTRVGVAPFEVVMMDDVWADVKVNFLGGRPEQAFRPVWLDALDLGSGSLLTHSLLRVTTDDDGAKQMIKDKHARMHLASVLATFGYRPAGMRMIIEHRTMAWDSSVDEALALYSKGAITVARGRVDAEPLIKGMFKATGGNPHMKAALESIRNLLHNELAMLPGQQGKDRWSIPESHYGREQYNKELIRAIGELYTAMPRMADIVWSALHLPYISFEAFAEFLAEIYKRLDDRIDHALEGWKESGYYLDEFVPMEGARGIPMEQIRALPAEKQAGVLAAINAAPAQFLRSRALSPREVRERGRAGMVEFPWWGFPEILGDGNCVERTLGKDYKFEFQGNEYGLGVQVYSGKLFTPEGGREMLAARQTYATYIVPKSVGGRQMMVITEPGRKRGQVLGYVLADLKPSFTDDAMAARAAAEHAGMLKMLNAPSIARHSAEGVAQQLREASNAAVIETAQRLIEAGAGAKQIETKKPDAPQLPDATAFDTPVV